MTPKKKLRPCDIEPKRPPGTLSLKGVHFNPAKPDDLVQQVEAMLTDAERVWISVYLGSKGGGYMNSTTATRLAFPEITNACDKGQRMRMDPRIALLVEWHLAEHGLTRERLLTTLSDWIYRTDPADAAGLFDGSMTLAQLRKTGWDTNVVESIKTTTRGKTVTREVHLMPKLAAMKSLLQALGLFDRQHTDTPGAVIAKTVFIQRNQTIINEIRAGAVLPTAPGLPPRQLPAGPPTVGSIEALRQNAEEAQAALEHEQQAAITAGVIDDPTKTGETDHEQDPPSLPQEPPARDAPG